MKKEGGVPKKDSDDLKRGIADESDEHPWLTVEQVRRLVQDHLDIDEDYYEDAD